MILCADFRAKGASLSNHCWCQSSRLIALSCGIKISAVHQLSLSQSTRDVTHGQTNTITTPKTALAYARAVKTTQYLQGHGKRNAQEVLAVVTTIVLCDLVASLNNTSGLH